MRASFTIGGLVALLAVAGCSVSTPEDEVRAVMEQVVDAAESQDVAALMEHVSDGYADGGGRDKAGLRGLVAFYLRQHGAVHVLYREQEVALSSPDAARARAAVALAGQPIGSGIDLTKMQADLYRVRMELSRTGGDWRITSAEWEPAGLADFIGD
jgi:hypothetical protein